MITLHITRVNFLPSLLLLLACALGPGTVAAQTAAAAPPQQSEEAPAPPERSYRSGAVKNRIDLLRILDLTPEQRAQIRQIRRENDAQTREAQRRRNRAQRALNQAIYAENFDEATVEARARELAAAHSEVFLLRTRIELRIRRLLTAEQLTRFREFRRQRRFADGDEDGTAPPPPPPRRRRASNAASPIEPAPSPR